MKFFHKITNHRKAINTILEIKNDDGLKSTSFKELSKDSVSSFKDIFKSSLCQVYIEKILKMVALFPHFINEDENEEIIKEITKPELEVVLHSFQWSRWPFH